MSRPIIIGIAGGTGSGKSTIARSIYKSFSEDSIGIIMHDSYYKDQSHLSFEQRCLTNYDHPMAFDTDFLISQLNDLLEGKSINMPSYDFTEHTRKKETSKFYPKDIIILEGILVLEDKRLRDLMDIKIYVDTDADIRILRRLKRDMEYRGRTVKSVIDQYLSVVRPMHMQFTEPSKKYADIIIPEGGHNKVAIDIMVNSVKELVKQKKSNEGKDRNINANIAY